jgi:hypothetical protein
LLARSSGSSLAKRETTLKIDYVWIEPYQAAMLETDHGKLQKCLPAAKAAIDARLHQLQLDHGGTPEEREAISDALADLNVIRRELEKGSQDTRPSNA